MGTAFDFEKNSLVSINYGYENDNQYISLLIVFDKNFNYHYTGTLETSKNFEVNYDFDSQGRLVKFDHYSINDDNINYHYNRDIQEIKNSVVDSFEIIENSLVIESGVEDNGTINNGEQRYKKEDRNNDGFYEVDFLYNTLDDSVVHRNWDRNDDLAFDLIESCDYSPSEKLCIFLEDSNNDGNFKKTITTYNYIENYYSEYTESVDGVTSENKYTHCNGNEAGYCKIHDRYLNDVLVFSKQSEYKKRSWRSYSDYSFLTD